MRTRTRERLDRPPSRIGWPLQAKGMDLMASGRRIAAAVAGVVLGGALALGSGPLAGEAKGAFLETKTVESPAINTPTEAFGPLRGQSWYTGALDGADREDWLQFWHVPRWNGSMSFWSSCPLRAELFSAADDALAPLDLVAQVDVTPARNVLSYRTSESVVRRMLVRLMRSGNDSDRCEWNLDTQGSGAYALQLRAPTVKLRAERKNGRTVAVVVTVQMQPRSAGLRPFVISITGAAQRTLRGTIPKSGTLTRRIPLPAGKKGALRVQVSAPATIRRAPIPTATSSLQIATRPATAPKPIVKRPRPKPARPIVRKPQGPFTKVPAGAFSVGIGLMVRPSLINMGESRCSFWFSDITWKSWGSTAARGSGKINQPYSDNKWADCVEMRHGRKIRSTSIRLSKPIWCGDQRMFTRVRYVSSRGRLVAFDALGCASD